MNEAAAIRLAKLALIRQKLLNELADPDSRQGYPGKPLLVERLDKEGVAYYLIPWDTALGTKFIVRVDASTGKLLGIVPIEKPKAIYFLSSEEALDRVRTEVSEVEFGLKRCIWFPCRQSTTPMWPFYEFRFQGGMLYVDMDGVVHRKLTPLGHGG